MAFWLSQVLRMFRMCLVCEAREGKEGDELSTVNALVFVIA